MLEKDVEKTAKGRLLQKYHAGVKGFFKDEEAVRMFDKMEGVEERLEFIWRSQAMQVRGWRGGLLKVGDVGEALDGEGCE